MKFNKLITHILESLTAKVHPTLDQEREAYSVTVFTEPTKEDISSYDPRTLKVNFDEYDGELWSQWWDANHDVLYQGKDVEQAFNVFCNTYRKLVEAHTNKWSNEAKSNKWDVPTPEDLQKCFDTVETNIKTTRQCIDSFKHIDGEWKVFDMGQHVDPLLIIGLEVDVRKCRMGGVIDVATDIAGNEANDITEW